MRHVNQHREGSYLLKSKLHSALCISDVQFYFSIYLERDIAVGFKGAKFEKTEFDLREFLLVILSLK